MQAYILLGALLGLPLLIGLFFRVSVAHLFLALLCGDLLQRYFTYDAQSALSMVVRNQVVLQYVGLAILILPMLLTAIFLRHTLSKGGVILHAIPLIISGVVFAAFAAQLLPGGLKSQLSTNHYGKMLEDSTQIIIGAMVGLQLITLWLFNRAHEKNGKHSKH
jgi:hypothetical protein